MKLFKIMYKDDGIWHLCIENFSKSVDASKEAWRLTDIHDKVYEVLQLNI